MARVLIGRVLILSVCLFGAPFAAASAQEAQPWPARAQAIAERVHSENLIVSDDGRRDRQRRAMRARGEARLMALYDIASDDYVASDGHAAATSLAALEREARTQGSTRFTAMAQMLRAYAPALDGDYLQARSELTQRLGIATDPFVYASGARLLGYTLTDLGMFGPALEAARAGLVRLPDAAETRGLRSGLHDAIAYNALRIGDYETATVEIERTVELDVAAGRPIDGLALVNNIAIMLARAGETGAAIRLTHIHRRLAEASHAPSSRFFADLLCVRVFFAAGDYAAVARCARDGRAAQGAPAEYLPRLMTTQASALARLGRGSEARAVLDQLKALLAERGDPSLSEQVSLIEPEVLAAEGHYRGAFTALRAAHEASERSMTTRFNDGARELRATLENQIAEAEQQAQTQAIRAELQARTLEKLTLGALLGGACLIGVAAVAALIYRSRRDILRAIARLEEILARRGGAVSEIAQSDSPRLRLDRMLAEIERRDAELMHAFERLEAAREEAERANLAKSHFLATMTHELRTPLNAIMGYGELLMESAEDRGDDTDSADLKRINASAQHLLAIVNDVLDLSKIEAGRMDVLDEAIDLDGLIDRAAELVRPAATANGNALVVQNVGLGVARTDGVKLSQCLLNLLSNAAKFTKNGEVALRVHRVVEGGVEYAVFQVADTGIGIGKDAQAKLFQPFVQADAGTTRAYGGTGLGLAITLKLAKMLGGDVALDSAPGRGSTFTLRLPLVAAKLAHAAA